MALRQLSQLDARLPAWDHSSLAERVCPFCGDAGVPYCRRPDQLVVRRCTCCGVFFTAPAPTPEQLDAFYAQYNERHRRLNSLSREVTMHLLAREPQSDIRMMEIASCFPETRGLRALDVGFGLGANLVLLRKLGFAVDGIELDGDAIDYVRQQLGMSSVRRAAIEELQGGAQYDVIIMHDLVEHPHDPMSLLRSATDLLKPGGIISIWTPNATFVGYEQEPVAFRVDLEHMQYLTLPSCAWIARRLGVDIVHLESVGFPSLKGIGQRAGGSSGLKGFAKSLPGVLPMLTRRRLQAEYDAQRSMREGTYHLFCLLRKPYVVQ